MIIMNIVEEKSHCFSEKIERIFGIERAEPMIGIINPSLDPFYNQALEEYLFQNRTEQDIFLLWRNTPAVIVGCYQNISQEVSLRRLKERGIPVVRRSSGGGTVYHDLGNVNYSLMKKRNKILEYDDFLLPVITALRGLGIMAEKNRCSDIAIGGKKISGSAQKVTGERVLHHGTLLYASDLSLLDEITTKNKSVHIQSKASPSAICKVCNISESWEGLGKEGYPFTELPPIESFMEALREAMGAKPEALALTEAEKAEVERICREKYHSWEWTFGKTPHFSFEKEGIFQGEKIRISYQARKGRIEDFTIQSPYFSEEEVRVLFQGQPFSLELFEEKFSDLAERLKPQDSKEVREVLIGLAL